MPHKNRPTVKPKSKSHGSRPIEAVTEVQQRTLEVISTFIEQHSYPPTMKELGDILGITPQSAHEQVGQLVKKGRVQREPGLARSLQVIDKVLSNTQKKKRRRGRDLQKEWMKAVEDFDRKKEEPFGQRRIKEDNQELVQRWKEELENFKEGTGLDPGIPPHEANELWIRIFNLIEFDYIYGEEPEKDEFCFYSPCPWQGRHPALHSFLTRPELIRALRAIDDGYRLDRQYEQDKYAQKRLLEYRKITNRLNGMCFSFLYRAGLPDEVELLFKLRKLHQTPLPEIPDMPPGRRKSRYALASRKLVQILGELRQLDGGPLKQIDLARLAWLLRRRFREKKLSTFYSTVKKHIAYIREHEDPHFLQR